MGSSLYAELLLLSTTFNWALLFFYLLTNEITDNVNIKLRLVFDRVLACLSTRTQTKSDDLPSFP